MSLSQSIPAPLRPWLPAAAAALGGWLATDALLRLSHLPLSPGFSLAVLLGGAWWLRRPRRAQASRATDVAGWLERLEQLQAQFGRLEEEPAPQRAEQLAGLRAELGRGGLLLALVGTSPPPAELQPVLVEALRGPEPLLLHWAHPLPAWSAAWRWPELFEACDGLLHHLRTPLSAADLRWLEALPAGQPAWLLVQTSQAGLALEALALEVRELRATPAVPAAVAVQALQAASEHLGPGAKLSLNGDRAILNLNGISAPALQAWLGEVRSAARAKPLEAKLQRGPNGYSGSIVLSLNGATP